MYVVLGGIGANIHSLPLIYAGLGGLCGTGHAFGFVIPLQYLLQWYPDKRGFAAGLAVTGFGGGAFISPPIASYLLDYFFLAPEYLGKLWFIN